jgi:hypothetical protein
MALIDLAVVIKGSSDATANGGIRMSVTAALRGTAASGLGGQRPLPVEPKKTT